MHHDQAVADLDGILHIMSYHQGSQPLLLYDFTGKLQNLLRRLRIQAAVCSSSKSSFGFFKVAIRRVKACLCPPDKSPTLEVRRSSSPSPSFKSRSRYSFLSLPVIPGFNVRRPPLLKARARFSSIPIVATVPFMGSWNTRPKKAALLYSGSFVTSLPSITIFPSSTGHTPAIAFRVVDFPAPFPPMIVTKSPSFKVRFKSFKACFSFTVPLLMFIHMTDFQHQLLPPLAHS